MSVGHSAIWANKFIGCNSRRYKLVEWVHARWWKQCMQMHHQGVCAPDLRLYAVNGRNVSEFHTSFCDPPLYASCQDLRTSWDGDGATQSLRNGRRKGERVGVPSLVRGCPLKEYQANSRSSNVYADFDKTKTATLNLLLKVYRMLVRRARRERKEKWVFRKTRRQNQDRIEMYKSSG